MPKSRSCCEFRSTPCARACSARAWRSRAIWNRRCAMSEIRHAIEPEELMAYLDGELASGRAAEAMTHLDRCQECQRLVADLRRVSQELTAWQVEPPNLTSPVVGTPKPIRRPLWKGL